MAEAELQRLLTGLALSLLVLVGAADSAAQIPADGSALRARGQGLILFAEHCASCHGETGRGDGPRVKALSARPSDLTRLAERNGGTYPAATVMRAIDGADSAHRAAGMPLWGQVFRSDPAAPDASAVKQRIEALTLYLEFIQARRPRW